MTIKALPSLSQLGWVTDPLTIGAKLFHFMLTSEKGQSADYSSSILSLQSLVVIYGNNPREMREQTKLAMEKTFLRYFDVVDMKVTDDSDNNEGKYGISVDANFGTAKEQYNLGFSLFVSPDTKSIGGKIDQYNG